MNSKGLEALLVSLKSFFAHTPQGERINLTVKLLD